MKKQPPLSSNRRLNSVITAPYPRTAGMRVSGDIYPESAKKRKEWELEAAGWYECGNSRLLYKTINDD